MSIRYLCSLGLMTGVLLAAGGCASADSSAPSTIYLDPETGQVVEHPTQQSSANGSDQKAAGNGETSPSTDSNATHPGHVVHCADGSLRMGSAGHGDDESDKSTALCSETVE